MNLGSVSAIITRAEDDKVFVGRRSKDAHNSPNEWETIGGKIEDGETPDEALDREIMEELQVKVGSKKFFKDYFIDFNGGKKFFKTYIISLADDPRPKSDVFEEWGWFGRDEIESMQFTLNCKERILDYFNLSF